MQLRVPLDRAIISYMIRTLLRKLFKSNHEHAASGVDARASFTCTNDVECSPTIQQVR